MKTFNDLDFKPHPIGTGQQALITFPNGLELSVVLGGFFYSNGTDTYEAWCSYLDEEPRGHLTADQVTAYMAEIQQTIR